MRGRAFILNEVRNFFCRSPILIQRKLSSKRILAKRDQALYERGMKQTLLFCLSSVVWILLTESWASAAVVHFYSNPRVPQPLFHVTLEYKSYIYEADPQVGGHRVPVEEYHHDSAVSSIEIPDSLVNEQALDSQMGLSFDFNFIWNNNKTYCAKLVGIALGVPPQPMNFAGTHYVIYHPSWIDRHDPGLSPDQIYDFVKRYAVPF